MHEAMRLVFLQVKDQLDAPPFGQFEVFGVDFVLEAESLLPKLIDFTSSPSFSSEMEGNKGLIYTLLRDVTTMASDLHELGSRCASPHMI